MSKINKSPRVLDLFDADMNQICKPTSGRYISTYFEHNWQKQNKDLMSRTMQEIISDNFTRGKKF